MRNRLIVNLMLLLMMASGCAHTSQSAKEPAKPDTALASTAAVGTPALEVPEWYFDFGEVKEGTAYLHTFVIRNRGTGVLEIKKVQAGCGTSLAGFDKAIPPGGEGKITIKLYPSACKSGDRKPSLVFTNDARAPRFTLVVQGKLN